MKRFVLYFTESQEAALRRTDFYHPRYAPSGWIAERGNTDNTPGVNGSFPWSGGVKVLAAYLLRCAAWAQRHPNSDPDLSFPRLEGGRGSLAASLNYAMSKQNRWLCEMFGWDDEGQGHYRNLFHRSNPDLKRKDEPVRITLKHAVLPASGIEALTGQQPVRDPGEMERLAEAIEGSARPKTTEMTGAIVTIRGSLKEWPKKKPMLEKLLMELGMTHYTIERVEQGSIKLTLKLPPEEFERLYWAVNSGEFDDLGVEEVSLVVLPAPAGDVTQLLRRVGAGQAAAKEQLFRLVEGELRELARAKLKNEPVDPFLQTTVLVNDAFLSLVKTGRLSPQNRGEFFAWASRVMRQKLIGQARRRKASKRGSGKTPVSLDEKQDVVVPEPAPILQALDDALAKLVSLHPLLGRIVQQVFFVGDSLPAIARQLGLSDYQVKTKKNLAIAFLRRELEREERS